MATTSRRSFLGASAAVAAAALFGPKISLRSEIDRERLMLPFCGENYRWDLAAPFGVGSLTYATDARRIIRAEIIGRKEVGERRIPNVNGLWRDEWKPDGELIPFEKPPLSSIRWGFHNHGDCPDCGGRRIPWDGVGKEYPNLDDAGFKHLERERGYDVDDNCVFDPACRTCRGRPYKGPSLFEFRGQFYSAALLLPIWDLPGVKIGVAQPDRDKERKLLFAADGFEGIVCPVFNDDRKIVQFGRQN